MTSGALEALADSRQRATCESRALLWENLEKGLHRAAVRGGTASEVNFKKMELQFSHFHMVVKDFFLAFTATLNQVGIADLRDILKYGAVYRSSSIMRNALLVCEIVPPNREKPLGLPEIEVLNDSLLLVYVHIMGVFDALAIAFHRAKREQFSILERKANFLDKNFLKELNNKNLDGLILNHRNWLERVRDQLRHRFVHRVPPYIPTAQFTASEWQRVIVLNHDKIEALRAGDHNKADRIEKAISDIGQFRPLILFVDSNEKMHLHPTLIDDVLRFQVISIDILEELVPLLQLS